MSSTAPAPSCTSCRSYVPQPCTVGVLFTNGKGWRIDTAMVCRKNIVSVRELKACYAYEREPGAD